MAHSGQQHPKADSGGQRPTPKDKTETTPADAGSTRAVIDGSKAVSAGGKKDAKK